MQGSPRMPGWLWARCCTRLFVPISPEMAWIVLSACVAFVAAGALAVTTPSSWPLLLARVVLIVVGIVLIVVAGRRRRRHRMG